MTAALLDDLATYMRENPGAVIEDVARERHVTPRAVLEALPSEMVTITGGADAFVTAMQDIATWGEVTLIIHTDDGILKSPRRCRRARSATAISISPIRKACTATCATRAAAASLLSSGRSWVSRRPSWRSSMSTAA